MEKPLLHRVEKKLRFALRRLLPPGIDYLGLSYRPKPIEVRPGDEIKLGAMRIAIEELANQLGLFTSCKIQALLRLPGHAPFGAASLMEIAEDVERRVDKLLKNIA